MKQLTASDEREGAAAGVAMKSEVAGTVGTFSRQIQQRMSAIEKRDWELWLLALSMLAIVSLGYFFVIFPAVFMGQRTFFIQVHMPATLLIGQLALLLLFLIYLVHKHIQVRGLRARSVIEALNYQFSHAQLMLDPLTQAFNRAALEEVVSKEINRVYRKQTVLVFLYIDVDNLKKVNTRFGHLSGDLVLSEVGAILKTAIRGSDYVIRMGGDEFLVVLTDTDVTGAEAVKNRIGQRADQWNEKSPLPGFSLDLSIGVAQFDGSRSFDDVLAEADNRMYTEKHSRYTL